ncbi:hypothetical protein SANTM175S_04185 [Streptomyces antimycoticus]
MDGTAGGIIKTIDVDRSDHGYREWLKEAVRKVQADAQRSADTHLLSFPLPERWGIDLYLKDESTHPTGSLKHRLARSLFLYGLCNGWIRPGKPVIEASSGSTAVSEAYFAKLIGVPFIAVMPRTTSREKCRLIEFHGGQCHFMGRPADECTRESAALAAESGGHYMDQFTYAEQGHGLAWQQQHRRVDLSADAVMERYPEPAWVVATAGTGGTSATLARYVHYMQYDTRVCASPTRRTPVPSTAGSTMTTTPPAADGHARGRSAARKGGAPAVRYSNSLDHGDGRHRPRASIAAAIAPWRGPPADEAAAVHRRADEVDAEQRPPEDREGPDREPIREAYVWCNLHLGRRRPRTCGCFYCRSWSPTSPTGCGPRPTGASGPCAPTACSYGWWRSR